MPRRRNTRKYAQDVADESGEKTPPSKIKDKTPDPPPRENNNNNLVEGMNGKQGEPMSTEDEFALYKKLCEKFEKKEKLDENLSKETPQDKEGKAAAQANQMKSEEKDDDPQDIPKNKKRRVVIREEHQFTGEMFLRKAGEPNVENIQGTDLYIIKSDLAKVKRQPTATAVARSLMPKVFTQEALLECSVFGKLSKSKGSANISKRTALNPKAVEDIIKYALARQDLKHLTPQKSEAEIKRAMSNVCVEKRSDSQEHD